MLKKWEYQVLFYVADLSEPTQMLSMCIMAMTKIHTALIRLLNLTNFELIYRETITQ